MAALTGPYVAPPKPTVGAPSRVQLYEVTAVNADGTLNCRLTFGRAGKVSVPFPPWYSPMIGDRVYVGDMDGNPQLPYVIAPRDSGGVLLGPPTLTPGSRAAIAFGTTGASFPASGGLAFTGNAPAGSVMVADGNGGSAWSSAAVSSGSGGTGLQGPTGPPGPQGPAGSPGTLGGSVQSGATYTLQLSDVNTVVWFTVACTVTIPASAANGGTVAWVKGDIIYLYQDSASGVAIHHGDAGISVRSNGSLYNTSGQDALVAVQCLAAPGGSDDVWLVTGDRA